MNKNILVIVNPTAGGGKCGKNLPRIEATLKKLGVSYDLRLTERAGDAEKIVLDLNGSAAYSKVLSVGGDGTINEVIQGLAGTDIVLGVIPLGTGNDFMKMLNLPKGLEARVELAINGKERTFDLGRLNERYFSTVVGIGFDAAVNRAHYDIKWISGIPAYVLAIITTMFKYGSEYMEVEITAPDGSPDGTFSKDVHMLTIGNGHTCGGGFIFTPGASCEDGELDLNILHPIKNYQLIWHLPKVFAGTLQQKMPHLATLKRFSRLKVRTKKPIAVHHDGEMYISDRLEHVIEVVPGALKVMAGPTSPTSGD
jgi:YegS/Rv2252/BmrU family lipid kinase